MFKTIDSLLEFTNETKFKRLYRRAKATQQSQQPEKNGLKWNRRRKDESAFVQWIVSRTMGYGEKINATNNEIPVNRSESLWDVFFHRTNTNEQIQDWKWSTYILGRDFFFCCSFKKTSFQSSMCSTANVRDSLTKWHRQICLGSHLLWNGKC